MPGRPMMMMPNGMMMPQGTGQNHLNSGRANYSRSYCEKVLFEPDNNSDTFRVRTHAQRGQHGLAQFAGTHPNGRAVLAPLCSPKNLMDDDISKIIDVSFFKKQGVVVTDVKWARRGAPSPRLAASEAAASDRVCPPRPPSQSVRARVASDAGRHRTTRSSRARPFVACCPAGGGAAGWRTPCSTAACPSSSRSVRPSVHCLPTCPDPRGRPRV